MRKSFVFVGLLIAALFFGTSSAQAGGTTFEKAQFALG